MWDAPGITILVQLGVIVIGGVVLGVWIWALKRTIADRDKTVCLLETKVRHFQRTDELHGYAEHVGVMTGEELVAEDNRTHDHPDLDSGDR